MFQNDCWADASGEMNFNMALPQIEDDFEDESPETAQTNEFLSNIPTTGPFKIIVELKGNYSNKIEKSFLQNQISNNFQIDAKVDHKYGNNYFTLIFSERDNCSQAQRLKGSQIDRQNLQLYVSRSEQTAFMRKVNTATKSNSHINRFSRDNRQQHSQSQDGRLRGQPGGRQQPTRYQRKHNFPVGGSIRKNRGKHKSRIQSNNTRKDVWKSSPSTRDNFREMSSSRIIRNKADPTRDHSAPERNESRFNNNPNSNPRRRDRRRDGRDRRDNNRDERSDRSNDGGRFRRNFGGDRDRDTRPRDLNRNEGRADASNSWRRSTTSSNDRKPRRNNRQTSVTEDGFSSTKKTVSRNRVQPKKKQEESLPVTKHTNAFAGLDDDSD